MTRRLHLHEEARAELRDGVLWYEARQTVLGRELLQEFWRRVQRAQRFPESGALIKGYPAKYKLRRFRFKRFPYSLVVGTIEGERYVIAVAHTSRKPGYWAGRLQRPPR